MIRASASPSERTGPRQLLDARGLRVALLGGARALAAILSFLAVALVARRLGPAELGLWSLALALHGYALHLAEFGLRSVVTAEAGQHPDGARLLLPGYLRLRLAITLGVIVLGVLASAVRWPETVPIVALVLASLVPIALQLDWVALVEGKNGLAAGLLVVRPLAFLLLVLTFPTAGDAVGIAALFLAAWTIAAIASWRACLPFPRMRGALLPAPRPRDMLKLGWPLFAVTLLSQAQISLDLVIVGGVLGSEAAGHYYLAGAIALAGLVFANAMGQLAMARMAQWRNDAAAFARVLLRELRGLAWLAVVLTAGLALIAPLLISFVFGAAYEASAALVVWFAPWFFLQNLSTLLQGAMTARQQQQDLLRANIRLLLVALPLLALAALVARPELFALARGLAEAFRLWSLVRSAPGNERAAIRRTIAGPLFLVGVIWPAALVLYG